MVMHSNIILLLILLLISFQNVAVDRILMALLDLGYTNFVRVGSLKKVARKVLPFTAQSNTSRGEGKSQATMMPTQDF
jgi:hypothetical protein